MPRKTLNDRMDIMKKNKTTGALATGLIALALLTGCGANGSNDSTATSEPTVTTSSPSADETTKEDISATVNAFYTKAWENRANAEANLAQVRTVMSDILTDEEKLALGEATADSKLLGLEVIPEESLAKVNEALAPLDAKWELLDTEGMSQAEQTYLHIISLGIDSSYSDNTATTFAVNVPHDAIALNGDTASFDFSTVIVTEDGAVTRNERPAMETMELVKKDGVWKISGHRLLEEVITQVSATESATPAESATPTEETAPAEDTANTDPAPDVTGAIEDMSADS